MGAVNQAAMKKRASHKPEPANIEDIIPEEEIEPFSVNGTLLENEPDDKPVITYSATEKLAIKIKISVEFKPNWGSKRLDSVEWVLKFVFEGENMDVYGSPSQFIKSVNVNIPKAKYGEDYRISDLIDDKEPTYVETIVKAPWTVALPFTFQGYTVTGNVVTINEEVHEFSLPINGLPQDFKLDIYCGDHSHDPQSFATSTILPLTVPRPTLDTNSKTVYHMKGSFRYWSRKTDRDQLEFKITTPTGNPSKILSALANGKIVKCTCTKTKTPGSFSLIFKADSVEYSGTWNGDEFSGSFENRDPDDFRPGTRHFRLPVTSLILKEDNPLNCLLDLPSGKLNTICLHIYQTLVRGFDRKGHHMIPEKPRNISELLEEVGVAKNNVDWVVATLSHPMIKFNAIADWNGTTESATKSEEIMKCFVWSEKKKNSYEPKLVELMSNIFTGWESQSSSILKRKNDFALQMKDEKKHFYNADRVIWLLVQQKCDLLRKMPKEIVKKIAYLLPPTLFGGLAFTCLYTEYGGCGGDSHYSLGVKLSLEESKKGRKCFIFANNSGTSAEENFLWRSENDCVVIFDPNNSKFKNEAMKFQVIRDQYNGGVLLEWTESKFKHSDHANLHFNIDLTRLAQTSVDEFLSRSKGKR